MAVAKTTEKREFQRTLREELTGLLKKCVYIKLLDIGEILIGTIVFVGDDYLAIDNGGVASRPTLIALAHIVSVYQYK